MPTCSSRLRSTAVEIARAAIRSAPAGQAGRRGRLDHVQREPAGRGVQQRGVGRASGRPVIAAASAAVSAASSGPTDSSVSIPVARIRTVQSEISGSVSM